MGRFDGSKFAENKRRREFLLLGIAGGAGVIALAALGVSTKTTGGSGGSLTKPKIPYATGAHTMGDSPHQYISTDPSISPTSDNAIDLGSPSLRWRFGRFYSAIFITGTQFPEVQLKGNQPNDRAVNLQEGLVDAITDTRPIFTIQDADANPIVSLVSVGLNPTDYGFRIGTDSEASTKSFWMRAFRQSTREMTFADTNGVALLSMDTINGRVAIGNVIPLYTLDVIGEVAVVGGVNFSPRLSTSSRMFWDAASGSSGATRLSNGSGTELLRVDNSTGDSIFDFNVKLIGAKQLHFGSDLSPHSFVEWDSSSGGSGATRWFNNGSTELFRIDNSTGDFIFDFNARPNADDSKDLGLTGSRWKQLWLSGAIKKIGGVSTVGGFGVPAIVAEGDSTGNTGTVASVAAYTVGAVNGVFKVGGDIDVTAFTSGTINLQVTYTDWNSGAQTITIDSAGVLGDALGNEVTLMAKASTSITIKTTGTFTATYNVAATIIQVK